MSKLIRTCNVRAFFSKSRKYTTATPVMIESVNKRLISHSSGQRNKHQEDKHFFDTGLYSIAIPYGITTVLCSQVSKHNEKRFLRAVQYGVEDEVKRLVKSVLMYDL